MGYSIIALIVSIVFTIALRQFDKKQGTLEKTKRYVEKLHAEFEDHYIKRSKELRNVSDDLRSQTSQSIATVKRLEELQQNYQVSCEDIATKHGVIVELSEGMKGANAKFQQIIDMSNLLEVNMKQIKDESKFVDAVSTNLKKSQNDLDAIQRRIVNMQSDFQEENTRVLEQYKQSILQSISSQLEKINSNLATAQKDADAVLDVARIKLNDIYQKALEEATKRANELESEAFETLKKDSAGRVAAYRRELNDNINATRELSERFKSAWQDEASGMVAKMQADFSDTEIKLDDKLDRIGKKLNELESEVLEKSKTLNETFAQSENSFNIKVNETVSNLNDKIEQLGIYSESRLANIKEQTDYRFKKFEATVNEFQTAEANLKALLSSVKQNILSTFESYKYENDKNLVAFSENFKSYTENLNQQVIEIENRIEELKENSYETVFEKIKVFEEEFFSDITNKKTEMETTIETVKRDVLGKLEALTADHELTRKELEEKYTENLKARLVELASKHKERLISFDQQIVKLSDNLTSRISAQDLNIERVQDDLKANIATAKENAKAEIKQELENYMAELQDSLVAGRYKIDEVSNSITEQIAEFEQNYDAKMETANNNFQSWKTTLDKQFDSARTLFNDKISSFGQLAESAIIDLQKKHETDVETFKESNTASFAKLKADVRSATENLESYKQELLQHSMEVQTALEEKLRTLSMNFDSTLEEKLNDATHKVDLIADSINDVKAQVEKSRAESFSIIQSESNRLTSSMQELNEKQNEYLKTTNLFERTDELKAQLEDNIKTLQAELSKLSVYNTEIDEVNLKHEKFSHQNKETLNKIEKFMEEKSKIDLLQHEFTKLSGLSESIERKQIELEASNDVMQKYQVQIRKLDDSFSEMNLKYQSLESKEEVLNQTISDIDKAFSNLNTIDSRYRESKQSVEKLSPEITKLQNEMQNLIKDRATINETIEKIKVLSDIQAEIESKMQSLQNSKEWLAGIESRLNSLDESVTQRIKLFATVYNTDDKPRPPNTTLTPVDRQNIIQLHHMGWTNEQIANSLKCTLSEIELILEFSDGIEEKDLP